MITAHPPSASEILRFLDFPREIRDKIYAECLVVEKLYPYIEQERRAWTDTIDDEFPPFLKERTSATASDPHPFRASPSDPRPPSASNAGINLDLLLTNRMIYAEASKILFSQNTFVMPTWHFMSEFFNLYAGKDQLNLIKKIELAFTQLDLFTSPQNLAIDERLSAHAHNILNVEFPSARAGLFSCSMFSSGIKRGEPGLDVLRLGRKEILTAWLRKAMLAKSLESCTSMTIRLDDAEYAFSRLDENALWPFVMPATPTLRPVGWTPTLPAGMQVEGLGLGMSLEDLLRNIQGYRLQPMPRIWAGPRP
ncbi:MAG: hypothetical protein OHK93_008471 [Ramalina farinacea]|uniref:DUF7730 domain-containing protein n=1 Tax=Ramalina farinacea TaxID=258253 RepID=A0AA43QMH6_9LECA|nr:hypothetical protein [Ramalina farinacea]